VAHQRGKSTGGSTLSSTKTPPSSPTTATVRPTKGNQGNLSPHTLEYVHSATRQFLTYSGIEVSDHAILDLVNYKRNNPLSQHENLARSKSRDAALENSKKP